MWIKELNNQSKKIVVAIPLTKGTEKTRIKKRSCFNEYGIPVSTKSVCFSLDCYVEWQIGYDVIVSDEDKLKLTTVKNLLFMGANGKEKTIYELSEYLYYFYKWGVLSKDKLLDVKSFLHSLSDDDFIDNPNNFAIERSHPVNKRVLGIDFFYTQVKYPILVHKFGHYDVLTEIKVTERQYAIGVQPMLYFCFPVTELKASDPLIGRVAKTKETADFEINSDNISIFLEILRIFGILSRNHNKDIITIIDKIMS